MNRDLEKYINHLRFVQKKSNNTISSYQRDLELFFEFLKKKGVSTPESDSQIIQEWIEEYANTHASSSLNRMIASLRSFYGWMKNQDKIEKDPTGKLSNVQNPSHLPRYFNHEQIDKLMDSFSDDPQDLLEKAVIILLYSSGLRVSELCSLKVQDLYAQERVLRITGKGNKTRMIPINEVTLKSLEKYRTKVRNIWVKTARNEFFINSRGNPLSRNYVYNLIKRKNEQLGFSNALSPHSYRHTYASHLLEGKADLRIVQELLGHSNIRTTQIYTHIESDRLKKSYDEFFGYDPDQEDD